MLDHFIRVKQSAELLHRKLSNFLSSGVLRTLKIVKGMQLVQLSLMKDETATDLQHPQEYGFTSKAKTGALAVAMFKGGNRDNGIVAIIYDRRYLPDNLNDGDSCQYDAQGNRIWLKGTDGILIKSGDNEIILNSTGITFNTGAGKPVIFNAPAQFTQTITAAGNIQSTGGTVGDSNLTIEQIRTLYNEHIHSDPQGGNTGVPNPLMPT